MGAVAINMSGTIGIYKHGVPTIGNGKGPEQLKGPNPNVGKQNRKLVSAEEILYGAQFRSNDCQVGISKRSRTNNGKVNIGFGVDKKLIPDVGRLGELVSAEFADIVEQTVGS